MQTGEQGSASGDRGVREDGVAVTGSEVEGSWASEGSSIAFLPTDILTSS